MDLPTLTRALLGDRRASQYIFSTPEDAVLHLFESLEVDLFDPAGTKESELVMLGQGAYPLVLAVYSIEFETDTPCQHVLRCLDAAREHGSRVSQIRCAYLSADNFRKARHALPIMCLCRDSVVKRTGPGRAQCVYDCRSGERCVEMYLGQKAIPGSLRMTA